MRATLLLIVNLMRGAPALVFPLPRFPFSPLRLHLFYSGTLTVFMIS